ncbi:MAG: glycosyltransferase family 2 protein [Paludibacteraceae bacterium]|nr:glycosyltransferase family 2 protein [Paludibacteraceae bacterium]
MRCSVIILNWNGADMLRRYLPSVVEHTKESDSEIGKEDCEIVVADNGSEDESMELLAKEFPTVHVLPFERNYGFAEGYNKALEATEAEYTVLLNSDVEVTAGWLAPLLDYMDAHPETAACQPKVLSWKDKSKFEHAGAAGGHIDAFGYPFCRGRVMSEVETDHGQYDNIAPVFWATGACLCIRTAVYKQAGGLDAGFFAHMEEIDLCWRLNCRGWKVVCIPQSVVYHLGGGALDYSNPRKTYLNFRNNLLMIYKNMPSGRLPVVLFCRFWLDWLAAFVYLLKGQTGNFKAVGNARADYHRLKKQYKAKRAENLRLATVPYPSVIYSGSVILAHYTGRKLRFPSSADTTDRAE